MIVILADPTGLCFGVKRAIEELERSINSRGKVYALGSPIHNPQEVKRLEGMGLVVVNSPQEVPHGGTAFIRAHGATPQAIEELRRRGCEIVDGTCPFVRNVQEKVAFLSKEGYAVVIVGDPDHPEVQGIRGYAVGNSFVVSDPSQVDLVPSCAALGVVAQTTQKEDVLAAVSASLVPKAKELRLYNTICSATLSRQEAVRRLAGKADGIIVIGGRNSANTGKLVSIAKSTGVGVQWVESADELDWGGLEGKEKIGIAAGASTPDWLIEDLVSRLRRRSMGG
jgi:4-hydroxy-3-methylbut-2-enyl diphosphate reductase